jgi:hypothetical protein
MRTWFLVILIAMGGVMPALADPEVQLLKARYTAVPDSDPEYAQGAIERHELAHREIEHFVWLIQVPLPGDVAEWTRKLNDAVDARHGSFRVEKATDEERRKVESGEITLQK